MENVQDRAEKMKNNVVDEAKRSTNKVMRKAEEYGDMAADRANGALSAVGEKISSVAETIRKRSPQAVAPAANMVADTLEQGGDYLSDRGISDIADDVTDVVKRYPMRSMWAGIGIGFLLGSAISRRSSSY